MIVVLTAIVWFNLFLAVYFAVKESIFYYKKKKIVPGALYEDIESGILNEVVDYDTQTMIVIYRHFYTKEPPFRPVTNSISDRDFIKQHRKIKFPYCKAKKFGRK